MLWVANAYHSALTVDYHENQYLEQLNKEKKNCSSASPYWPTRSSQPGGRQGIARRSGGTGTGAGYTGGQTVEVAAPLDTIPLFLRDGAKLPIRG